MILDGSNEVSNPHGWVFDGQVGKRPLSGVIGIAVHHTAIPPLENATEEQERERIRIIDQYHVSQGFGGIGYHYMAFPSGRCYRLVELDGFTAGVWGRNEELCHICVDGEYVGVEPSEGAVDALVEGLEEMLDSLPGRVARGHSDWALSGHGTACPGSLDGYLEWNIPKNPTALEVWHSLGWVAGAYQRGWDWTQLEERDREVFKWLAARL